MRQYLSKSTTGLRTDLYKFSACLCVQQWERQQHALGGATAASAASQALICHSSETGQALYHLPFETKKGIKVIAKKINELIFVKRLEQSLTQGRHSVFAN